MAGHDGHRGVLYYLAVDPAFQKKGFGKAAVAAAERWLRERGVRKIDLMVRSENEMAGRFYEHMGYEINPGKLRKAPRHAIGRGPMRRRPYFCLHRATTIYQKFIV